MALKQCSLCDRKFTKLEHVKRHERSHTRERPYECPTCGKHFSRSDVLFRHCKGHIQNGSDDVSTSKQARQLLQRQSQHQAQVAGEQQSSREKSRVPSNHDITVTTPHQQEPSLSPLSARGEGFQPAQAGQLSHQANGVSLSPTGNLQHIPAQPPIPQSDNRLEALLSAAQHLGPPTEVPWQSPSPMALQPDDELGVNRSHALSMPPPADTGDVLPYSSHGHMSSLDQWAFELVQSSHPLPNRTPADALQTWLFPLDNDMLTSNGPQQMALDDQFEPGSLPLSSQNRDSPSNSTISIASKIPRERFARVESCWPSKHRKPQRLMPTLWQSLAACHSANIFSEGTPDFPDIPLSDSERRNSRWGLDEECRDVLQKVVNSASQLSSMRTETYADTTSSNGEAVTSPGADSVHVPPAEILDIALEMYLRYFHPTLPIIHLPTFSAKNAPRPLLLCMCLIGLSILGTTGALRFVSRTFPTVLQMVVAEVQAMSASNQSAAKQMRVIATGLLALNLASISGRKARITQAEQLYSDLVKVAQNHGLFNASEGPPPESFVDHITDLEARWKAWSRIDCAKRIIIGLVEADCWYAAYLSTGPSIRTDAVQLLPPSDYSLYHATSASKWNLMIQRGVKPYTNRIMPSYMPAAGTKLECSTLRCLLTILLLRSYESNDRMMSLAGAQKNLEPWRFYLDDHRSQELVPLLVNLSATSIDCLRHADVNSAVLWHASCMLLGANIYYFELAAGRAGPGPAVNALEDISLWTQTRSARRAVLHAAHIYKLLSDRKVSDIVNPNSVVALFQAALVLGLYIFTVPPTGTFAAEANGIELLDILDWTHILQAGLTDPFPVSSPAPGYRENAAVDFIRNGGQFSMAGIALDGGYLAARRTLLHCADLMDGIGRWKSRTFSQILHIMSDDLTETNGADDDEEDTA